MGVLGLGVLGLGLGILGLGLGVLGLSVSFIVVRVVALGLGLVGLGLDVVRVDVLAGIPGIDTLFSGRTQFIEPDTYPLMLRLTLPLLVLR